MKSTNENVHIVMHPLISSIQKIALYETKTKLCIIASNNTQSKFRVLNIDRMEPLELFFVDDGVEYTQEQVWELVQTLDPGGRSRGFTSRAVSAFGIVGFVRFLEGYYLIVVTKRRRVAVIGLHTIYKIEDTAMIYIPSETVRIPHPDEPRYLKMFQSIDLSSNFYFSYSYDITRTLQVNMAIPINLSSGESSEIHKSKGVIEDAESEDIFAESLNNDGTAESVKHSYEKASDEKKMPKVVDYSVRSMPNRRFVWNLHLIEKMEGTLHPDWILYIMHGFVSQSNISVFGRSLYITLIARRSNKYAGTRFLKRGANFEGDVANEVETEQVLEDTGASSCDSPRITSFVQMRGSIPAHWSQDISKMVPKPAITFDLSDPFAEAAGSHFNDLLKRYGSPIIILNLVKKREKKKHESQLSEEFSSAVRYLNKFLPPEHSIQYISFDMARMNKGKEANVMGRLADIARSAVNKTGIYQIGVRPVLSMGRCSGLQTGIIRVNCVDCLDRTNTAQFALGKCALGYQLCALGILDSPSVDFDTDCVRLLEVLYEDHGDTLALQYGGSQLVHRIKTYRKTAPWTSQGNDIMQTLSRYYSNTFSDAEKQHAMNLFLGLFVPEDSQSPIWDMITDYYLHHSLAAGKFSIRKFPLTQWWEPEVIDCLPLAYAYTHKICGYSKANEKRESECIDAYSDFHRPHELSVLNDTYAYKISHSVRDFMPHCVTDFSPFTVRVRPGRRREDKGMKNPSLTGQSSTSSTTSSASKWLLSPWMRLMCASNLLSVDSFWLDIAASCLHPARRHFNRQNISPTSSGNSSSMESDDEDFESKCSDSHQSSPAKDVYTSGIVTFQSLFPSMKQTYGVDISSPSRSDSILYKRYVLTDRIVNQPFSSKQLKLTCLSSFSDDSSFEVTPPKVDNESLNIYKHYVAKSNGSQIDDDVKEKYKRYINCELGVFHSRG